MRAGAGSGGFTAYAVTAFVVVYGGIAVLYVTARVWQRIEARIKARYAKPAPVIVLPQQAASPSLRLVPSVDGRGHLTPAPGPYTGGGK